MLISIQFFFFKLKLHICSYHLNQFVSTCRLVKVIVALTTYLAKRPGGIFNSVEYLTRSFLLLELVLLLFILLLTL